MPQFFILALVHFAIFSTSSSAQCPNGWIQSDIYQNKCYLFMTDKKNWFNADEYCQNAAGGSHLTSISAAFENANIVADASNTVSSCLHLWIGANDIDVSSHFVWADENPFNYKNWETGQPNQNNHCASMSLKGQTMGKWKTEFCGTLNCFVCESYTTTTTNAITTRLTTTMTTTMSTTMRTTIRTTTPQHGTMTDCYDWRTKGGATTDGIYHISPPGIAPFDVWCDMTSNGGGWTVFQKRIDSGTVFWNRLWVEYKNGFGGGLDKNFWLGLDRIHVLSTKDSNVTLRVDAVGNRCHHDPICDSAIGPNTPTYGEWKKFSVENEGNGYLLHVSLIFVGNITKQGPDSSLAGSNNMKFTTVDVNNDSTENCATFNELGGWWHNSCSRMCLNGKYYPTHPVGGFDYERDGSSSTGYYVMPITSQMKLRRET